MPPTPPSLDHLDPIAQLLVAVRDLVIAQGRTDQRLDELVTVIGRQADSQAAGVALVSRVLDAVFGSAAGRMTLAVLAVLLLGPRVVEAWTAFRGVL